MLLSEYETTVVLRPDISGDIVEATLDRVRGAVSSGGKLLSINHWGRRRLAYEIERHGRGIYVHTHYLGAGGMVAEIERNLRLSENVLRFLTVKLEDEVDPGERDSLDYEAPDYSVEEEAPEETLEAAPEEVPAEAPEAAQAAAEESGAATEAATEDSGDESGDDSGTEEEK